MTEGVDIPLLISFTPGVATVEKKAGICYNFC